MSAPASARCTLILYACERSDATVTSELFRSTARWLHPLFELERYLRARELASEAASAAAAAATQTAPARLPAAPVASAANQTAAAALTTPAADRSHYILYDTLVGIAAAYLILHLCLPVVVTKMASVAAIRLLAAHNVDCSADTIIPAVNCRTEVALRTTPPPSIAGAYATISQLKMAQLS